MQTGKGHSKIFIVADHVEFKPQLKGKDSDEKTDEPTADEQVQEEGELKEAAYF
jgi:hypothetical protein